MDNYNNDYNNGNETNNTISSINYGQLEPQKGGGSKFALGMVVGFLITAIVGVIVSVIFLKPIVENVSMQTAKTQNYENSQAFLESVNDKLSVMQSIVDSYYYFDEDYEKAADSIYQAFLTSIGDDYGYYYNKEAYESLMQQSIGSYCGIGAVVQKDIDTGYIKVVQPYKNAPAFEAGVRTNDLITEINGESVVDMDLNAATDIMKGEEGTKVNITILRDGETLSFDIVRRVVEIITVEYEMLEDNIGYIYVSSFEGKTAEHFQAAVESLIDDGAESLIVDLRNNGGGLLTAVVDMLDYLLPEGVLVYTEDKAGNKVYEKSDASCVDIPIAVIINGNSASASEVFTGAMQDYDKAIVVGETSFGKGIVQTIRPLGDGTAIKFTTSAYYTPNGRNIHGTGIEPDIEVKLPEDEEAYEDGVLKREYDTQLQEAVSALEGE